jgi:hypothetical protein
MLLRVGIVHCGLVRIMEFFLFLVLFSYIHTLLVKVVDVIIFQYVLMFTVFFFKFR